MLQFAKVILVTTQIRETNPRRERNVAITWTAGALRRAENLKMRHDFVFNRIGMSPLLHVNLSENDALTCRRFCF